MHDQLLTLLPPLEAKRAHQDYLEQVIARYGPDGRPDLQIEYDDVCREILLLEQYPVDEAPSLNDTLTLEERLALPSILTHEIAAARAELDQLTAEVAFMPAQSAMVATKILHGLGHTYDQIVQAWQSFPSIAKVPASAIRELVHDLAMLYAQLHPLTLRQTHRQYLSIVQNQLAAQQQVILTDDHRRRLQQAIDEEQAKVEMVEQRLQAGQDVHRLLELCRRNLQWYQEMYAGIRPVVPQHLLHHQLDLQRALDHLDQLLTADAA